MLSPSPRLLLARPEGSDSFSRTVDFQANWDTLDTAPGIFTCTSTTRPTWTSGQANRMIFETDTNQVWNWTGSTWTKVSAQPQSWAFGASFNNNQASNTTLGRNVYTVAMPRAGVLTFWMNIQWMTAQNTMTDLSMTAYIDSVNQGVAVRHIAAGYLAISVVETTLIARTSALTAGNHIIGFNTFAQSTSPNHQANWKIINANGIAMLVD